MTFWKILSLWIHIHWTPMLICLVLDWMVMGLEILLDVSIINIINYK